MRELRNLNELNRGIYKQWIWGTDQNYYRSCDFLQKISYSIQDLNAEIKNLFDPTMKEVVYIIALIDWIRDAVESIPTLLINGLDVNFQCPGEDVQIKAKKYFLSVRSFVVAHPLNTTRHGEYGLDGDFICVDVRQKTSALMKVGDNTKNWYHLCIDGMKDNAVNIPADFILYAYSQKSDGNKYFKFIGVNFSDLYYVAELQIEKLYALDRYLSKLRKKDWIRG